MKTRKELTAAYKEMKFKMGVFQIRNVLNDKIFVEGSINLDAIWNRHRLQLDIGSHPSASLQNDWKVFGAENFRYEILSEIKEEEGKTVDYRKEVRMLEKMFLEELQPFDEKGYNQRPRS